MKLESMAAAEEILVDTAVATVLSELDANFTFKEEHNSAVKAFLDGYVFPVLPATSSRVECKRV